MNIQIFGKKKCFDTKKAERWFKERRIKFQQIDLVRFGMSGGELDSVLRAVGGVDALIDWSVKSPEIDLMRYTDDKRAKEDKLFDHPELMKTPIVRNGKTGHRRILPGGVADVGINTKSAERDALRRFCLFFLFSACQIEHCLAAAREVTDLRHPLRNGRIGVVGVSSLLNVVRAVLVDHVKAVRPAGRGMHGSWAWDRSGMFRRLP